jgi:AraC-like DNA-binding protein
VLFGEQVMCALNGLLATGGGTAGKLAQMFACSERTLRARLQREGLNLQKMQAEARYQRACHLLRSTDLPVSLVATAVGYADTAVFSRAFSGWAGVSPRPWREASVKSSVI